MRLPQRALAWYSGPTMRARSDWTFIIAREPERAVHHLLAWLRRQPFGRPVEPDVYIIIATSSSATCAVIKPSRSAASMAS